MAEDRAHTRANPGDNAGPEPGIIGGMSAVTPPIRRQRLQAGKRGAVCVATLQLDYTTCPKGILRKARPRPARAPVVRFVSVLLHHGLG